jgi:hypothetical protein
MAMNSLVFGGMYCFMGKKKDSEAGQKIFITEI